MNISNRLRYRKFHTRLQTILVLENHTVTIFTVDIPENVLDDLVLET